MSGLRIELMNFHISCNRSSSESRVRQKLIPEFTQQIDCAAFLFCPLNLKNKCVFY
uniref:Uncharacterized protein n=1 Tax=Daphnia magna TaxID=35525 RepID=A0A0P5TEH7_9CRUS